MEGEDRELEEGGIEDGSVLKNIQGGGKSLFGIEFGGVLGEAVDFGVLAGVG